MPVPPMPREPEGCAAESWPLSPIHRTTLTHDRGDRLIFRRARCAQTANHAGDVRVGAILTHLPLALEPVDRQFHPNDGLHLLRDVVCRRIAHVPWPIAS